MKCKKLTNMSTSFNKVFEYAEVSDAPQKVIKTQITSLNKDLKKFAPVMDNLLTFVNEA